MKLLRVGQKGSEKPAVLDKDGKMSSYETARQKAIEENMNK